MAKNQKGNSWYNNKARRTTSICFGLIMCVLGIVWAYSGQYFLFHYQELKQHGVSINAPLVAGSEKDQCAHKPYTFDASYRITPKDSVNVSLDCNGNTTLSVPTSVQVTYLESHPDLYIVKGQDVLTLPIGATFAGLCVFFLFAAWTYSETKLPKPKSKSLAWMWAPISEAPLAAAGRLWKQGLIFFGVILLVSGILTIISVLLNT